MVAHNKKATELSKAEISKMITEQITRAVQKRGLVEQLFVMLDSIENPAARLKLGIELLKFIAPQMASTKIEVEQQTATVERIVFQQREEPKVLVSND